MLTLFVGLSNLLRSEIQVLIATWKDLDKRL